MRRRRLEAAMRGQYAAYLREQRTWTPGTGRSFARRTARVMFLGPRGRR